MSFREELSRIKQEKDARDFFRKNNNEIANFNDFVKTFLISLITSVLGGFLIVLISSLIKITSILFFFIVAYALVMFVNSYIKKSTNPIKVISIMGYTIGVVVGVSLYYVVKFGGFNHVSFSWIVDASFSYLFFQNVFNLFGNILAWYYIFTGIK